MTKMSVEEHKSIRAKFYVVNILQKLVHTLKMLDKQPEPTGVKGI